MTLNKLASAIAKREGKKSQARIGDIREILKIIATLQGEWLADSYSIPFSDSPLHPVINSANKIATKVANRKAKARK